MELIPVDDIDTDELQIYHKIRDNAFDELNSFVADSPKVVNILLDTDLKIESILATNEYYEEFKKLIQTKNIPKLYLATKEQMQGIVGHKIHHHCMMHGIRPSENSLDSLDDNILMLDAITSSENIGSIARSGAALAEITNDSTPLSKVKVSKKWVLLMGHEGLGLSKDILDICDEVVNIEMADGVRSLNVAVASSLMMYQFKSLNLL
ncbi:TrmH family RNA methyltransferase [Sulfurimonas sp. CS5]|uniref:TrmH family RNA methyltransferase n=1 Tax=Sulfurimonas sp. CS5 TaxID=3391145 RepID=UPI0039E93A54